MLLTRKAGSEAAPQSRLARGLSGVLAQKTINRRGFLKRSGLTVGAGAVASQLPFSMIGKADAQTAGARNVETKRTVCTHCSVGCAIDAVVENGVWVRQEPVFDSPFNLGAHCAKGASIREHGMTHDSHRLKYPVKLVGGKWQRISWDQAYDEIAQKLLAIKIPTNVFKPASTPRTARSHCGPKPAGCRTPPAHRAEAARASVSSATSR